MKILINTSTLYLGGGVQVAISFLNELTKIEDSNEYFILISKEISKQLNKSIFNDRFEFFLIEKSPSSLLSRFSIIQQLDKIENKIKPDIIFTVFGPSYWRPKGKHIIGFADGWVYNSDTIAYSKLSFLNKIKMKLLKRYKTYYLNRDADYIIIETEDAKQKLSKIININTDKIFVVGNTYSEVFNKPINFLEKNKFFIKLPQKQIDEHRLLYIAHNHPAKNLDIIKLVIPYLKNFNIKFVLTIDNKSFDKMFKNTIAENYIINLGSISSKSCPSVYMQCDYLFAPTLLETFSAAYPESMIMKKPILTTEYSFAKDICQDSAIYFNPMDPIDISNKIISLLENKELQKKLVKKGLKRVASFETAKSRARKYIMLCSKIVSKEK